MQPKKKPVSRNDTKEIVTVEPTVVCAIGKSGVPKSARGAIYPLVPYCL